MPDITHHHLTVTAERLAELNSLLNTGEQARANRFRYPQDRQHFTAARGLLRETLAQYINQHPRDLCFQQGPHGKPYLVDNELHFNLSHSADRAIIAVANHPVGVDIEHTARPIDRDSIARRYFHPNEWSRLSELPAVERQQAFFAYWTCKEAILKALGQGLTYGLANIELVIESGQAQLLAGEKHPGSWQLQLLTPVPEYLAAVAFQGPVKNP